MWRGTIRHHASLHDAQFLTPRWEYQKYSSSAANQVLIHKLRRNLITSGSLNMCKVLHWTACDVNICSIGSQTNNKNRSIREKKNLLNVKEIHYFIKKQRILNMFLLLKYEFPSSSWSSQGYDSESIRNGAQDGEMWVQYLKALCDTRANTASESSRWGMKKNTAAAHFEVRKVWSGH